MYFEELECTLRKFECTLAIPMVNEPSIRVYFETFECTFEKLSVLWRYQKIMFLASNTSSLGVSFSGLGPLSILMCHVSLSFPHVMRHDGGAGEIPTIVASSGKSTVNPTFPFSYGEKAVIKLKTPVNTKFIKILISAHSIKVFSTLKIGVTKA